MANTNGNGLPHREMEFTPYKEKLCHVLVNASGQPMQPLEVEGLVEERGFEYCQYLQTFFNHIRKNVQISIKLRNLDGVSPMSVMVGDVQKPLRRMTLEEGDHQCVDKGEFRLALYAIRSEMPDSVVTIRQSHTNGKLVDYEPIKFACPEAGITSLTVPRVHFGETTKNNQRKDGHPNPDQQYFRLVVEVQAVTDDALGYPVLAYASEGVIVR